MSGVGRYPANTMASDDSPSEFDPELAQQAMAAPRESGELPLSRDTLVDSSGPPALLSAAPDRSPAYPGLTLQDGEGRLDDALEQVTHTEASLGRLARGLRQLAQGARSVRDENSALLLELERLRLDLTRSQAEERALRIRTGQLEQRLDQLRRESARERDFLVEQQDSFLRQVLNDHERQRERLEAQLELARQALEQDQ